MTQAVLPDWAIKSLVGKTIESVSQTPPGDLRIEFVGGDVLCLTALPLADGTLDASLIENDFGQAGSEDQNGIQT